MFGSFFVVIQIKGCKALSHVEMPTMKESLKLAETQAMKSFPSLDWEHMKNQEAGELYCDVGITIHPGLEDTPLVGLWGLDCLEASYGTAGFLNGHLHTINTLSMFGGMQAEAPKDWAARTHFSFVSTYNLSWEAVRPKDNEREFFKEEDVYQRQNSFHKEMKEIEKVLGDVRKGAFGVRWEGRMGSGVLKPLCRILDDNVCATDLI